MDDETFPLPDHVADALARKHDAEAEKFAADARALNALTATREIEAQRTALSLEADRLGMDVIRFDHERQTEKRRKEKATDYEARVYRFTGTVDAKSVTDTMSRLTEWVRLDADDAPERGYEIIFSSPGGSVIDGLHLFDFIQEVKAAGHPVITSTFGYAASMAGILLQAGTERVMSSESWLLIHKVSFGAQGSFDDVMDRAKWIEAVQDRVLDIFANRAQPINPKTTKRFLDKNWERKDWWISSDEAVRLGLVDRVNGLLTVPQDGEVA